ncbi:MAG: prepilin-type N-terminal cleavage/methylation domain-containing protein [Burkholderiaceae bacterium]|nr:prepilin-type N-terminal cleavage/methylation domain-containing protein [Burkholderiaceae bacterium]
MVNYSRRRLQTGFSLVEMSVVLLVIGLILGGVSIGKDMQRNAEYVKIKQKFVDPWVSAYNSAYTRSGVVIGDSQTEPRFMVNGATYAVPVSGIVSGGNMTSVTPPGAMCQGAVAPAGSGEITSAGASVLLHDFFDNLGVRMPAGRAEGREDRYVYLDSNGNPQEIQICFQWNKPGTASGSGNVMVITGLTPDLARALDQMIDGKSDAQEGLFRWASSTNATVGQAGAEWPGNNTNAFAAASPSSNAAGAATRKDEDQVYVMTAHYKLNQ